MMNYRILFPPSSFVVLIVLSVFASNAFGGGTQCQPWSTDTRNRIFVLSDISNEPDDSMSMVRLLVHSDNYIVEGLVAITSFWLPNVTRPDQIQAIVDAYGKVQENLQSHSNFSFPTAADISSKIASGPTLYGMEAIQDLEVGGSLSTGTEALIRAVDASPNPLYVQIWGGANTLASALWYVNRTRSVDHRIAFTSKIRVYSISDQDDTGPWIRQHFPDMRWIASRDGFNMYGLATWSGISGNPGSVDAGGPNDTIVQNVWLDTNIRLGPLGRHYPQIAYIMEGDSPSLLYNFQNGLGNPEFPNWGSWGGRYAANPMHTNSQFADAIDTVVGLNNKTYSTNKATIWRWREAFQNEFAARIQWTLAPLSANSSATHPPIVVVNETCGSSHIEFNVTAGGVLTLDASSSYSPDVNANLNFTWSQYLEPSSYSNSVSVVPILTLKYPQGANGRVVQVGIPKMSTGFCVEPRSVSGGGVYNEAKKCPTLHLLVKVKDINAKYPIERYRRVLLHIQPYGEANSE